MSPSNSKAEPRGRFQVEFKVIDGLAVAYGDLVLGIAEDPKKKSGMASVVAPHLWEREIPYVIDAELPNPERVLKAIDYFNAHASISFVRYDNQPDALVFKAVPELCLSYLGRIGGMQSVRLANSCDWLEVLHEMMHALGFIHEQSRPDRDAFIEVLYQNIEPDHRDQFAKVPEVLAAAGKDSSFDYHSLMLYPVTLFAQRQGIPTMRSKTAESISPIRDGLSEGDLRKLTSLYGD